ncbi:MAG: bifunctional DNA primase/polymerase, partial [Anaerolineae bacterium]|nr:bifunctional DNA primase/polymerase [Anaerolineae bacterium]
MTSYEQPPIIRAAQASSLFAAAEAYALLGFSVLPLIGKRPALPSWTAFQTVAASGLTIADWHRAGLIQNVGLICGAISRNLVVLDLDGAAGYPAFAATFPHLTDTFTVATGGGVGRHVYFYTDRLPLSLKAMGTPIGNLELCANGRQVVAPPSIHPVTGQAYRVEQPLDILRVPHLDDLATWIESFKPREPAPEWKPPRVPTISGNDRINQRLLETICRQLEGRGFKPHGDWLHGRCLHPERHRNGDRNPSFGFNTVSGYGHCYVCGTLLAKDIAATLGIDPAGLGGVFEKPSLPVITASTRATLPPAPP